MENPLLTIPEQTNEMFIPFDKIKDEHFEPAFEMGFKKAREEINSITENPKSPNFENTIEALEGCASELGYVSSIFDNLKEAHTNSEIDRIAEIIAPKRTEFSNDIILNEKLFERVKAVFESKPLLATPEQHRLLEKTYKSFTRNGALLNELDKLKLREIDKELAILSKKFSENLLKATNEYTLVITEEKDLAGIPERVRNAAQEEAKERGIQGWMFTLKAPSIGPFLQFADSEILRKQAYMASASRAMSGTTNNQLIILQIIKLRDAQAKLLGYKNYIDYVLENRMAKESATLENFFSTLYEASYAPAKKEFEELAAYKEKLTGDSTVNPWDTAYFTEKLQKEKYDFSDEELRPYFSIENVVNGIFEHAKRLYGLIFTKRNNIPVYHPDVSVYEVNHESGKFIGLLYVDFFPRESKRGGGWIETLRMQHKEKGMDIRSQLLIVCNLTKPTQDSPSLLNYDEAETIFHEFGHALHCLLSDCTYKSLAGFNTLWDFVELPSQLMQTWIEEEESLKIFAKHYQTQEPIPNELIKKLHDTKKFQAAWGVLGQLASAVLDVRWHEGKEEITDIEKFESEILEPYRFIKSSPGTSISARFKHIFDGGYAVGYYSYHWAQVLAADAFEYFKEKGLFSREVAEKFKEHVLSKGNTEEPMELYKRFRGREPDPKALLRSKGLL